MNGLSLFSGIGGLDVALSGYVRPFAYCEINSYCQGVLLSRMVSGDIINAPIWDDIKTLHFGKSEERLCDIMYGGFPCQDISIAGNGKGLEGERSGLFFEMLRLAKEIKPKFIFIENVPAIRSRGGLRVVSEITHLGYDCRWCVISAASVGALHKRERWFLLAHSNNNGTSSSENGESIRECFASGKGSEKQETCVGEIKRTSGIPSDVSYSGCFNERSEKEPEWACDNPTGCGGFWEIESPVGRLADGIPYRVDRLRSLGNSVVPQQAKKAFEILMGISSTSSE